MEKNSWIYSILKYNGSMIIWQTCRDKGELIIYLVFFVGGGGLFVSPSSQKIVSPLRASPTRRQKREQKMEIQEINFRKNMSLLVKSTTAICLYCFTFPLPKLIMTNTRTEWLIYTAVFLWTKHSKYYKIFWRPSIVN